MARVISQLLDELGNFYLLKDDGILEKRDPDNALLWSQQTRQEPTVGTFVYANRIALDADNDLWLTFSDALNVEVRSGATGLHDSEVLATPADVIVPNAGGTRLFALSTSRGVLYEINQVDAQLIRSFDLTAYISNYVKGVYCAQITSSHTGKIYFPALVGEVAAVKKAALVRFDPAGDGAFFCYVIPEPYDTPILAVSADVTGLIYASTLHGALWRFTESAEAFYATYAPAGAAGVVTIVTFTNNDEPVLVDDGSFTGTQKTRIVDPANGDLLSSVDGAEAGALTGDPLGYHHIKLTRINLPPIPVIPAINAAKLAVYVKADGTITFTGAPGAVTDTLSVECRLTAGPTLVGTATPNTDGSFSVTSAPGVANPAGEAVSITAVNGSESTPVNTTSEPRDLPAGYDIPQQTFGLVWTGVSFRLKAKVLDGGSPVAPAPGVFPIFRVKRDSDGKWFNGSIFVADNGDYLVPAYDTDGEFWYADVTLPSDEAGTGSFIIKDSPPYFQPIVFTPPVADAETLEAIHAAVTSQGNAFGAIVGQFTDPNTVGGWLFERINSIQKDVRRVAYGLQGARNVVIESILADVSSQATPKGSTPTLRVTVFDADRRFPVDITGAKVWLKAKLNLTSGVLAIDRAGSVVDGQTGQADIKLTAADTATVQQLTAQIVLDIPGTGVLLSQAFTFEITDSVL